MTSRVLITGASGQDGLILGRVLSNRGYSVTGIGSFESRLRQLNAINPGVNWLYSDKEGNLPLSQIGKPPSVVVHLAATSSVAFSWEHPHVSLEHNLRSQLQVSEYCLANDASLIFSASSEIYPRDTAVVNELTQYSPSSPYGIAKAAGAQTLKLLRRAGKVRGSVLSMFNHESPLRQVGFLTRSLADQICEIGAGTRGDLRVGKLDVSKDFSWAPDFVRVLADPLLWKANSDFVLASGKATTVRELAESGMACVGSHCELLEEANYSRKDDVHPTGDAGEAEKVLGFQRTVAPLDILPRMVAMLSQVAELGEPNRTAKLVELLARDVEEI